MNARTIEIIGPEPITLEEAKVQVRYEQLFTARDSALTLQISAAREFAENTIDKAIVEQRMEARFNGFPDGRSIPLPKTALIEVEEVSYLQDGDPVVLDPSVYSVDDFSTPGCVFLRDGQRWPDRVDRERNSVRVRYIAGIRLTGNIDYPNAIKQAMLMMVGHFDMNPQGVVTGTISSELQLGVDRLLHPYRRLGM